MLHRNIIEMGQQYAAFAHAGRLYFVFLLRHNTNNANQPLNTKPKADTDTVVAQLKYRNWIASGLDAPSV